MTMLETLKKARALIADESRWCTEVMARNAAGEECEPNDPAAVCWCGLGALCRVGGYLATCDEGEHDVFSSPEAQALQADGASMVVVNDYQGHAAAMQKFDRTIERLEHPG